MPDAMTDNELLMLAKLYGITAMKYDREGFKFTTLRCGAYVWTNQWMLWPIEGLYPEIDLPVPLLRAWGKAGCPMIF